MPYDIVSARYIERQEELIDSEPQVEIPGSQEKSNLTHEDKIFRSMNLKTLVSCLTEVRDILDRASDLMVSGRMNYKTKTKSSKVWRILKRVFLL